MRHSKNIIRQLYELSIKLDQITKGDLEVEIMSNFVQKNIESGVLYSVCNEMNLSLKYSDNNYYQGEDSQILIRLSNALAHFKKKGFEKGIGIAYNNMGNIHMQNQRYNETIICYNQSLMIIILEQIYADRCYQIANAYSIYADSEKNKNKNFSKQLWELAIDKFKMVAVLDKKNQTHISLCRLITIYSRLSAVYLERANFTKNEEDFDKALSYQSVADELQNNFYEKIYKFLSEEEKNQIENPEMMNQRVHFHYAMFFKQTGWYKNAFKQFIQGLRLGKRYDPAFRFIQAEDRFGYITFDQNAHVIFELSEKSKNDRFLKEFIKDSVNYVGYGEPALYMRIELDYNSKNNLIGLCRETHEGTFVSSLSNDDLDSAFQSISNIVYRVFNGPTGISIQDFINENFQQNYID
ncbi:hypothetical protein IMG5_180190 [Ichthyophthirius multifiliis]|uniref:Tetratricopeptide repeat protein n=1 Tax=Ichthyophthirius multifiliis TaxID=5932 RepID=G0R2P4_ICHMU|nr:hypothetical protein IMG5_180190 [Ichthyophthirius multifiliis]EGR28260.1 hypothetical protein IMG5_180190 [Ichthyophthirius multifiliis]|eukprot:XP_004027605.1 hypothetical protein IMG5_180190 [Ichthyophthirius multifiliis]